jgi:putative zinc finger/helix-turn-helix YgiT family protein
MTCFVCDAGTLSKRLTDVEGQIKRRKYTVKTWALVCDQCGHVAVDGHDMQEFMRKVADAYRKAHKLLTSEEIRRIRGGLSQQKFALELGVGVASVKRWELGLIQDRSSNQLILEFQRRRNQTWTYETPGIGVHSSEAASLATAGLEHRAHGPPFLGSHQLPNTLPGF